MARQTNSLGKLRADLTQHRSTLAVQSALLLLLTLFNVATIKAQTFSVLHGFTGGLDGSHPYAGVTVGRGGTLYGTTSAGGLYTHGTVFKLTQRGSGWTLSALDELGHIWYPYGGMTIGPNGVPYGTTMAGGSGTGVKGTVFELRPPFAICQSITCFWNESILFDFNSSGADGANPAWGNLIFDGSGGIYGTTDAGGPSNAGVAFQLVESGGVWTENVLHNFSGGSGNDGMGPDGLTFDTAGNLYGTTVNGGSEGICANGCGTVYQLMPLNNGTWMENVLVYFNRTNGSNPFDQLFIDEAGHLYGTASGDGPSGDGAVFELSQSGGVWNYSIIYAFSACSPHGSLTMDSAGNLYGTCYRGGAHQDGWIFELTNCGQMCIANDLHDFSGSDGANPFGGPNFDANGNLYGTTFYGGPNNLGVVWEIAQ
jgi:uncharacterized repeat protein (TIGR03803 family)